MDPTRSLLSKPFIDDLLKMAKRNLEQDGGLAFVLFVKMVNGQGYTVELVDFMSAENSIERQAILSVVGQQLRDKHGDIHEAVLLGGGWCVSGQEPGARFIPPSEHPARQEAITIFGRDTSNSRFTTVIQPFTKHVKERLVWQELLIAEYNRPTTNRIYPVGIIDALFEDDPTGTCN